jgi:hypothetical protein
MQLQNLLQSNDSNYIFDRISSWQKDLATADQVVSLLSDVQHAWSNLKSIFSTNEDIRGQFPEHAVLFDHIDDSFKVKFSRGQFGIKK